MTVPDAYGADGEIDAVPSVAPRRLHPLSPLVSGLFFAARAWPVALLSIARGAWLPMAALVVGLVVWRSLVWLRTTYGIGSDGLTVRSGIVWRNVQVVPPQRVQQVEVRRQLRHRVTGLAVVRIGLAGGGADSQVELDALSDPDAVELAATLERWRTRQTHISDVAAVAAPRAQVLTASGAVIPPPPRPLPPPRPPRPPLLRLTTKQLIIAGLTSRSLWVAPFVAVAAFVQFANDSDFAFDSTDRARSVLAASSPVLLVAALLVVGLVVAAVGTVISHYDLTVEEVDDDLVVRRGLLDQRTVTIPRDRVQYVVLAAHVIRRRLRLAALDVRTADLGGGAAQGESSTSIPIGDRAELDAMVPELLRGVDVADTHRHPPAAVRRSVVRYVIRGVPVAALVGLFIAGVWAGVVAAAVGLLGSMLLGWLAGRRLRSGWNATAIVTERGVIAWRRTVVPIRRVQSVGILQNPFQRRLGLATVRLDVAGSVGGVELLDVSISDATALTDLLRTPLRLDRGPSEPSGTGGTVTDGRGGC